MKFRNVGRETVDLPTLGVFGVKPGDEIEATGDDAKGLGDGWKRSDRPSKRKTHDEDQPQEQHDADDQSDDTTGDEPAAPEESA